MALNASWAVAGRGGGGRAPGNGGGAFPQGGGFNSAPSGAPAGGFGAGAPAGGFGAGPGGSPNQPGAAGQTTVGGTSGGSVTTPRFGGDRAQFGGRGGGGGGLFNNGAAGPFRLFGQALGGQASWLLPLALIGLAVAATRRRLHWPLIDPQDHGIVLWGVWLLTVGAFFSVAGFFHSYYLVTFAPAVAALAGIGTAMLWRFYRQGGWRGWLLPLSVLVTAIVQVTLLQPYANWNGWLTPVVLGLSMLAVIVLVLALLPLRRILRVWAPAAAAVGVAALLIAPTVWAADTTLNGNGGMTPAAGPSGGGFGGFGGGRGFGASGGGDTTANGLLTYLEQHQGTTKYLLVMQSSTSAASYIIQTGRPIMALGGFSGSDPILTLAQLQALVKNNTVRYFDGVGGGGFGGGGSSSGIGQWVQSACTAVPASDYGSTNTSSGGGFGGFGGGRGFVGGGGQLYDCAGAVK